MRSKNVTYVTLIGPIVFSICPGGKPYCNRCSNVCALEYLCVHVHGYVKVYVLLCVFVDLNACNLCYKAQCARTMTVSKIMIFTVALKDIRD